jgi:hypothetical protein
MNVMNRPMFRAGGGANKFPDLSGDGKVTQKDILIGKGVIEKQEGGGIGAMMPAEDVAMMPDQMPAPMAQQPPMDPLAQDVLMAREEGEKIGLDYLAETMDGIDMASNTEELINSIRGNDRPLQDRVAELATFVGEQDAMQTPESVLTMVQPTIMMTEEGAIDSGVGGLIQQVIGDTDMGEEMSQGVGALMAQGQPAPEMATPMAPPMAPPQQFAVGGAVKKFAPGGEATADPGFQTYYDQYLPVYQNLIAESEEERDRDRGLALAKAGFQFASGRDAKGRNIAGSGFLANLASAGETLIGDISTLDQERRKSQRAAKTLALQSAFATDQAERSAAARMAEKQYDRITKLAVEELKQLNKVNIGLFDVAKTGTDIDGRDLFSVINTATGAVRTGVRGSELPSILNEAARIDAAAPTDTDTAAAPEARTVGLPMDSQEERSFANFFKTLPRYARGELNKTDLEIFETNIDRRFAPEVTEQGVSFKENIPVQVAKLIQERVDADLPVNINPEILAKVKELTDDPLGTVASDEAESLRRAAEIPILPEGFDASNAFGIRTNIAGAFGRTAAQLREATENPAIANAELVRMAEVRRDAQQVMDNLATQTLKVFLGDVGGRPLKSVTSLLEGQVNQLRPGNLNTDEAALKVAKVIRTEVNLALNEANDIVQNPKLHPGTKVSLARTAQKEATRLLQAYDDVISQLEAGIGLIKDVGPAAPPMTLPVTGDDSNVRAAGQDAVERASGILFGN